MLQQNVDRLSQIIAVLVQALPDPARVESAPLLLEAAEILRDEGEYVDTAYVADAYNLSNTSMVLRMCRAGRFPGAIREGKSWRIPRAEIENARKWAWSKNQE